MKYLVWIPGILFSFGCNRMPPERSPHFNPEQLSKVNIGTTRDELTSALGPPIPPMAGLGSSPYEVFRYAQPGAIWWFGEYRNNVRGDDCIFWLRDGHVISGRFINSSTKRVCLCEPNNCPKDWAKSCL